MKPHFFDIWQRQFEIYMVKCKILNTSERDQFLHCMNKLNTFIRTTMVIAYGKAKGEQMERGKLPENEPWNIHKLKKVWLVCINKLKHSLAFLVYKSFYLRMAKWKKGNAWSKNGTCSRYYEWKNSDSFLIIFFSWQIPDISRRLSSLRIPSKR